MVAFLVVRNIDSRLNLVTSIQKDQALILCRNTRKYKVTKNSVGKGQGFTNLEPLVYWIDLEHF